MTSQYDYELFIASLAVQRAAILTQHVLSTVDKGAIEKDDLSPVTIGDFAAQALLISALHHSFPTDNFVGEESADALRDNPVLKEQVWNLVSTIRLEDDELEAKLFTPKSVDDMLSMIDLGGKGKGAGEGRTWVLDPIDGTATFIRGEQYAINLALLVDGKEQVAVLGCPVLDIDATIIADNTVTKGAGCLITAIKDHGAFVRYLTKGALAAPAPLGKEAEDVGNRKIVFTDGTKAESTLLKLHEKVYRRLHVNYPPKSDLWSSLMKYAALAMGSNTCIRIFKKRSYHSCIWDHAGGQLIFTECGGKITDIDGRDIDFSLGRRMSGNYGLVCAPANQHERVLETVREVIKEHAPELLDATAK